MRLLEREEVDTIMNEKDASHQVSVGGLCETLSDCIDELDSRNRCNNDLEELDRKNATLIIRMLFR